MTEEMNIDVALVETLKLPDLADAVAEVGELGVDALIDESILRDVPILGSLVRAQRTVSAVRDYIFARKVLRFLGGVAAVPHKERIAFLSKSSAPEGRRRLGETLVLLLDRLDDMEKADLLSRLFTELVRGRIDEKEFRRLAEAVDRVSLAALPALRKFYAEQQGSRVYAGESLAHLASIGLVGLTFLSVGVGADLGGMFTQSELGKRFLEVLAVREERREE